MRRGETEGEERGKEKKTSPGERSVILPSSGAHVKHDGGMRRNISLSGGALLHSTPAYVRIPL